MSLAVSLLKLTPNGVPNTAYLKVVPSGNYTPGGDTLNLNPSTWSDPNGLGLIGFPDQPPAVSPSVFGTVGFSGSSVGGYGNVVPGTTLATYKLQQFAPGGGELANAAYPAGVATGYYVVEVVF